MRIILCADTANSHTAIVWQRWLMTPYSKLGTGACCVYRRLFTDPYTVEIDGSTLVLGSFH